MNENKIGNYEIKRKRKDALDMNDGGLVLWCRIDEYIQGS